MEKLYDRHALIEAYITARNIYHNDDITSFNAKRLAALEQAFNVQLSQTGIRHQTNKVLWMLFNATVDSYRAICTPGSNFLDGGLLIKHLDSLGDDAQPLFAAWETIDAAAKASQKAHLMMIDELFKLLWGAITTVVTSQQLRLLGFDDSQELNWLDYE